MRRRIHANRIASVLAVLLTLAMAAADERPTSPPGLTVSGDGVLLRHGLPYRGIGVNYFNAFSRLLEDASDTSFEAGFDDLKSLEIPFARVMFAGFYPKDWSLYLRDKEAYFALMDRVVRVAERTGVGLVPSLFFASAYVCDVVGEPRSAWGDPSSKTIAFMRAYVEEVVTRYRASDAIWAWEFANEFNLDVDLPNAAEHRPPVVPHWGSPESRSAADDIVHADMVTAFTEFAKAVRGHDTTRPVTSGASLPRPAAEHLRTEKVWTQDSRDEFKRNLISIHPAPMDLVSVHMYPFDKKRFDETVTYEGILRQCMAACASAGMALFVGEFGASTGDSAGDEQAKAEFVEMVSAIEAAAVPLAAVWVFDFPHQDTTCNITRTNKRAYMLDIISKANSRLRR